MGGKDSQDVTVGYRYYLGVHMALTKGPIDAIEEIRVDDKLAWVGNQAGGRINIDKPSLFGGDEQAEGGITGPVDIDLGGTTQGQNVYLVSKCSPNVPAYRGIVGAVLRHVYMGNNPYLKPWSFNLKRIHTRKEGVAQWYDAKSEILQYGTVESANAYNKYSFGIPTSIWGSDNFASGGGFAYHTAGSEFIWKLDLNNHVVVGMYDGGSQFLWSCITAISPDGTKLYTQKNDYYAGYPLMEIDTETMTVDLTATIGSYCCSNFAVGESYIYGSPLLTSKIAVFNRINLNFIRYIDFTSIFPHECISVVLNPLDDTCYALARSHWAGSDHTGCMLFHTNATGDVFHHWDLSTEFPNGANFLMYDSGTDCCFISDGYKLIKWSKNTETVVKNITLPSAFNAGASSFQQGPVNDEIVICGNDGYLYNFNTATLDVDKVFDLAPYALGASAGWIYDGPTNSLVRAVTYDVVQLQYTPQEFSGDMNPAHIIRECLNDPDWGMGYADADIDDDAFGYAADKLYDERLGMSILWDNSMALEDFIQDVLRHISASLYVNRKTGKFVLKLIRGDYDINQLITLNESNIDRIENFSKTAFGEMVNSVTVNYYDRDLRGDASRTIRDIALINLQGGEINTKIDYKGFANINPALQAAARDLKTLSFPRMACTIYANRDAKDLNQGDCFLLSWADFGIVNAVMRIQGISYGDGKQNRIVITCLEDIFSIPDIEYSVHGGTEWNPIDKTPTMILYRLVQESPYYELVLKYGQSNVDSEIASNPESGCLSVADLKPTSASINSKVFINAGSGYKQKGMVDFCPHADLGEDIDEQATTFSLANADGIENVELGEWVQIDSELMEVDALTVDSITVKRGILDTIPVPHTTGAKLFFDTVYKKVVKADYVEHETIQVKLLAVTGSGTFPIGSQPANSLTFAARAYRPYPPGNVKINDEYFPVWAIGSLTVFFAHRNRVQQTAGLGAFVGWYEASVTNETATTYEIEYQQPPGNTIDTETGVTAEAFTPYSFPSDGDAAIVVRSRRDGYGSFQEFQHTFYYSGSAFDIRVLEDGSTFRTTEDGDYRRSE